MRTRLIVDSTSQLQELEEHSRPVKIMAKIISYVFHPVFVPVYIVLFILYVLPDTFISFPPAQKTIVLLQAVVPYVLFPVITVLLLKALNFISTVYLTTRKDRIIPYIACNIWYFWIWNVWKQLPGYPREIVLLSMTIFLASTLGFLINIYMKISMHAIAMGVLAGFLVLLGLTESYGFGLYIFASLLVCGLVCTARFIASDHTKKEIYGGILAGLASLLLSSLFV